MDGCLRVIADKGLEKLSIRDIANESGIARQTVYKHFKNKEALLAAVFQREGLAFANEVASYIAQFDDGKSMLIEGFIYVVRHFNHNPILAQISAPGSTFLADVGMKYFAFADFGYVVFADFFDQHPQLAEHAEAISELWIRNALSFISMPGPYKDDEALRQYVAERLLPGVGLGD
jgi:AcrR family transcriptional regulator